MSNDDDLVPEEVPGFKVSTKKTLAEYSNLDAEDESLVKWKKSLGLNTGALLPVTPGDKRTVVIISMTLKIRGEDEPVIIKFDDLKPNEKISFKIKEKSIYQLIIKFKVQFDIITGLKYLQAVKKTGITV
ncbi:hypothetical protein CANARDRAFT_27637, partial [[Candida] arabinofermentans NRRL YB-2248]